jgi:aspartyl protease family protein
MRDHHRLTQVVVQMQDFPVTAGKPFPEHFRHASFLVKEFDACWTQRHQQPGTGAMARYLIIAALAVAAAAFVPDLARHYLASGQVVAAAREVPTEPETTRGPRTLVLKAGRSGHYEVSAHVNGRPVRSLIDTGASVLALPAEVARQSGIVPQATDYKVRVSTANGIAMAARVKLRELRLGSIRLSNVEALVMPEGALEIPLIGMSVLGRLAKVDIRNGTMRLIQ